MRWTYWSDPGKNEVKFQHRQASHDVQHQLVLMRIASYKFVFINIVDQGRSLINNTELLNYI